MMMNSVLLLRPRLDAKPWGGTRLAALGLALPPKSEPLGEALATASDALVQSEPWGGRTLAEVVAADPDRWLGARGVSVTGGRTLFPLLIKLIDAGQHLSIQVHPTDETAPAGKLGKTEAWHILAAEPGAMLFLGLQPGTDLDDFARRCQHGVSTAAECLVRLPAVPGTTVLIPAGTVHALGAGVLVYEVQQPSDVTYRLEDWGRRDAAGNPRDLHLESGLAVLDPAIAVQVVTPVTLDASIGRRQMLTACRYFALERIALMAGERLELHTEESPQVLTSVRGRVIVSGGDLTVSLAPGDTAVGAVGGTILVQAIDPAVLLRAYVPDLVADVVRPARAARVPDHAIAALGEPLGDVRRALTAD